MKNDMKLLDVHSKRTCLALLCTVCLLLFPLRSAMSAAADDVARLYALPPVGSAYVRVANPEQTPVEVSFGPDHSAEQISAPSQVATQYYVVPGGKTPDLKLNGVSIANLPPAPADGFLTVVFRRASNGAGILTPIPDEGGKADGLKAELVVYNLIEQCHGRVTLPNGKSVFTELIPDTRAARAINPVTATLTADCGGTPSAELVLPALAPGDRYSLFLMGTREAPALIGQLNRTAPYRQP